MAESLCSSRIIPYIGPSFSEYWKESLNELGGPKVGHRCQKLGHLAGKWPESRTCLAHECPRFGANLGMLRVCSGLPRPAHSHRTQGRLVIAQFKTMKRYFGGVTPEVSCRSLIFTAQGPGSHASHGIPVPHALVPKWRHTPSSASLYFSHGAQTRSSGTSFRQKRHF